MNKEYIKRRTAEYEYYANGFHRLNAVEVLVRNVRIRKDRVIADIVIRRLEENTEERFNNCEYPLSIF